MRLDDAYGDGLQLSTGELEGGAAHENKPTSGPLRAAAVLQRTATWLFPFWDGPSALPLACSSPGTSQASSMIPARGCWAATCLTESSPPCLYTLRALMGARWEGQESSPATDRGAPQSPLAADCQTRALSLALLWEGSPWFNRTRVTPTL